MVSLIGPHSRQTYTLEDLPARAPRAARLFSLEQRAHLRGAHPRLHAPRAERAYAAGVALRSPGGPGERLQAYVVIGEVDTDQPQSVLRVVEHLVWTGVAGTNHMSMLQWLGTHWRCRRILVAGASGLNMPGVEALPLTGAARASLAVGLLRAVNAGRLHLPMPDRSQECQDLWAQIVKAQCRVGPSGAFDFFVSPGPGGDGWLAGLALAAEAGCGLLAPSQGLLTGLLCA